MLPTWIVWLQKYYWQAIKNPSTDTKKKLTPTAEQGKECSPKISFLLAAPFGLKVCTLFPVLCLNPYMLLHFVLLPSFHFAVSLQPVFCDWISPKNSVISILDNVQCCLKVKEKSLKRIGNFPGQMPTGVRFWHSHLCFKMPRLLGKSHWNWMEQRAHWPIYCFGWMAPIIPTGFKVTTVNPLRKQHHAVPILNQQTAAYFP